MQYVFELAYKPYQQLVDLEDYTATIKSAYRNIGVHDVDVYPELFIVNTPGRQYLSWQEIRDVHAAIARNSPLGQYRHPGRSNYRLFQKAELA